jgi:hypothetical protein
VFWVLGAVTLVAAPRLSAAVAASEAVLLAVVLVLLERLRTDLGPRRDEAIISAIAIVGRAMVLVVIAQLSALDAGKSLLFTAGLVIGLTALMLAAVGAMLVHGPRTRLRLPDDMLAPPAADPQPVESEAPVPAAAAASVVVSASARATTLSR